jgi:hypothetical protein
MVRPIPLRGGELLFEERLIYFPSREMGTTPDALGVVHEDVFLDASDGVRIHGWFLPAGSPQPERSASEASRGARAVGVGPHGSDRSPSQTILVCHGNAGNIGGRLDRATFFHRILGVDVFLFDYRGFGRSDGRPSEEGTYRDAVAAYRYLTGTRGIPGDRIVLFGESLGAAVAIELALRERAGALVLEAPFTSVADMVRVAYPFLTPFTSLVRTRYDNLRKIHDVTLPLLVFHGRRDPVVPFEHGEALFRAAREPKTFVALSRAGHADGYEVEGDAYWSAWKKLLESRSSRTGER